MNGTNNFGTVNFVPWYRKFWAVPIVSAKIAYWNHPRKKTHKRFSSTSTKYNVGYCMCLVCIWAAVSLETNNINIFIHFFNFRNNRGHRPILILWTNPKTWLQIAAGDDATLTLFCDDLPALLLFLCDYLRVIFFFLFHRLSFTFGGFFY